MRSANPCEVGDVIATHSEQRGHGFPDRNRRRDSHEGRVITWTDADTEHVYSRRQAFGLRHRADVVHFDESQSTFTSPRNISIPQVNSMVPVFVGVNVISTG